MQDSEVVQAIGEEGFTDLVAAFYRHVRADDLIGPMYPDDDWEGAEKRLRDFLIFRFGGPDRYIQERGHPRLGMRHAAFKIDIAQRDRWLELMKLAMDETNLNEEASQILMAFFGNVAEFLRNK